MASTWTRFTLITIVTRELSICIDKRIVTCSLARVNVELGEESARRFSTCIGVRLFLPGSLHQGLSRSEHHRACALAVACSYDECVKFLVV